jgi:Ca2+-binding RTX toxin-like protein
MAGGPGGDVGPGGFAQGPAPVNVSVWVPTLMDFQNQAGNAAIWGVLGQQIGQGFLPLEVAGNNRPVAGTDSLVTGANPSGGTTPFDINHSRLLANDTDADGETLLITSVQMAAGNTSHGTVTSSGTTVTFTPTGVFTGTTSFEYTVNDGSGGIVVGTVNVDVKAETNTTNPGGVITGTAGIDVIFGTTGNDTIDGLAGNDLMYAGNGNDILNWDSSDTSRIDGGAGTDTLKFTASGETLNLTTINDTDYYGRYTGIEKIDLTGTGDNSLVLNVNDVLNLSDTSDRLTVEGNAGDSVSAGSGWTQGTADGGYDTYTSTDQANAAELYVDSDITVT